MLDLIQNKEKKKKEKKKKIEKTANIIQCSFHAAQRDNIGSDF